jgi:hypothetical protein
MNFEHLFLFTGGSSSDYQTTSFFLPVHGELLFLKEHELLGRSTDILLQAISLHDSVP